MAIRAFATRSAMLDNGEGMLRLSALDQVMQALTQEARQSVERSEQEAVSASKRWFAFTRTRCCRQHGRYVGANAAATDSRRELPLGVRYQTSPSCGARRTGRQDGEIIIKRREVPGSD